MTDDTPIATSRTGASGDQPQWGQRWTRNLVSDEKGLPDDFDPFAPAPEPVPGAIGVQLLNDMFPRGRKRK